MIYLDETLLTLHYASRAMNIKNKPVKEVVENQNSSELHKQVDYLQKENAFLKEQIGNLVG